MSKIAHLLGTAAIVLVAGSLAGCQTMNAGPASHAVVTQNTVQDDERTRELYLSVIEQLVQYGKFHAALAHIDEFELRFGPTARSHALRGDAWLALGEFDSAEKEFNTIARGPFSGVGHHGLGSVAAKRGNWEIAAVQFEDAVHAQPTNAGFLSDLGHAYTELGRDRDAEFVLKKAQELSPGANTDMTPEPTANEIPMAGAAAEGGE